MRNKELFDLLETGKKNLIEDAEINAYAKTFALENYKDIDIETVKKTIADAMINNPSNNIKGHEKFSNKEFIIGVTQFIDNLIMQHGINGLQILEHDYMYYKRLNPGIKFAQIGNLKPSIPLIISMPFAGHCDIHKNMKEILTECLEKNIPVHLDCAWLSCAEGIDFDVDHPTIKSFACSLSKAYSLGWNRIGIRWSKKIDSNDSITIYNQFSMYNDSLCKIGYHMVKKFPINFYWQKYKDLYLKGCRETFTFPTKIIWLVKDMHGNLYGMSKLLQHLQDISVTN